MYVIMIINYIIYMYIIIYIYMCVLTFLLCDVVCMEVCSSVVYLVPTRVILGRDSWTFFLCFQKQFPLDQL